MDELKNLLISPAFWIASVFIAFLMSFFAGYAKDWTDHWFVRHTAKKDAEARLRQRNFEATVRKLTEKPYLLSLYQTNIVYQKLRQVLYLVVIYVCLTLLIYSVLRYEFLPSLGLFLLGSLVLFQAWSVTRRLNDLRAVVNAVLGDDETHFVG